MTRTMAQIERDAILDALAAVGGSKLEAAKALGIGKTTLYRKLAEYKALAEVDEEVRVLLAKVKDAERLRDGVALQDTKIESMVQADEPCPDCGSQRHRSCDQSRTAGIDMMPDVEDGRG